MHSDVVVKLIIFKVPKTHLNRYKLKFSAAGFGFVTFVSQSVGRHVVKGDHVISGYRLSIRQAEDSRVYRESLLLNVG